MGCFCWRTNMFSLNPEVSRVPPWLQASTTTSRKFSVIRPLFLCHYSADSNRWIQQQAYPYGRRCVMLLLLIVCGSKVGPILKKTWPKRTEEKAPHSARNISRTGQQWLCSIISNKKQYILAIVVAGTKQVIANTPEKAIQKYNIFLYSRFGWLKKKGDSLLDRSDLATEGLNPRQWALTAQSGRDKHS